MPNHQITLRGLDVLEGNSWVSSQRLRIGRMPGCEIIIDHTSVSRQHAEILFTSKGWVLHDLGSTNGTYLNGMRVGGVEVVINAGDIILVGEVNLWVQEVLSPAANLKKLDDLIEIRQAIPQSWDSMTRLLEAGDTPSDERNRQLQKIIQIGRNYASFDSMDSYLETILWDTAELLDARSGAILLQGKTGVPGTHFSFSLSQPSTSLVFNQDLANWVRSQKKSLLCRYPASGKREPGGPDDQESMILVPLRAADCDLGVLCLARSPDQPPFIEKNLFLADTLAQSLAASIVSFERFLQVHRDLFAQTLTALSKLIFLQDNQARRRAGRLTEYALLIAQQLGLGDRERYHLKIGTPLIDLGKLGVQSSILEKSGPLNVQEKKLVRSHVTKGIDLLESIPALNFLMPIIRSHHECWDGSGYPDGLKQDKIPLLARIVSIADAFDTMTSSRPFRNSLSLSEAFQEIEAKSGTQFDPACAGALLDLRAPIEELFQQHNQLTTTVSREELQETLEKELPLRPLSVPRIRATN